VAVTNSTFQISNEALIEKYLSEPLFFYLLEKLDLKDNPTLAKIYIAECLKMLLLIPQSKGNAPISREVDEVWHLLILETRQYEELCQKLPNKKFIHHDSVTFKKYVDSKATIDRATDLKNRLSWFASYYVNFGPFTPESISCWPLGLEIMKDKNISLDQLNQLFAKLKVSEKPQEFSPKSLESSLEN